MVAVLTDTPDFLILGSTAAMRHWQVPGRGAKPGPSSRQRDGAICQQPAPYASGSSQHASPGARSASQGRLHLNEEKQRQPLWVRQLADLALRFEFLEFWLHYYFAAYLACEQALDHLALQASG